MFITLESIEGAGKGSFSRMACIAFELSGTPYVHTRQPGGTPIGETIRELLLWKDVKYSIEEEVLLLAVTRKRTYEEVIRPALDKGKVVLCERWNATTMAYQGAARNQGNSNALVEMRDYIYGTFKKLGLTDRVPDVSFLFTVDPLVGLGRKKGDGQLDRFEVEKLEFFQAAASDLYRTHKVTDHWMLKDSRILDSNLGLEEVATNFLNELARLGLIKPEFIEVAIRLGQNK